MAGNNYRSLREEIANSITHGIGLALSLIGLCALVVMAATRGSAWHVVGCSVFGGTLVALYGASTLYHAFQQVRIKRFFRRMDHICIFLLIAGTYTPFTLTVLRGAWGWTLLGLVWGLAAAGIALKLTMHNRFVAVSAIPYVLMGWLAILAIKPIVTLMPAGGVALMVGGGVAYTVGVLFYALDRIPYFHTVWHLFVLCGSVLHFLAVMYYVVPSA